MANIRKNYVIQNLVIEGTISKSVTELDVKYSIDNNTIVIYDKVTGKVFLDQIHQMIKVSANNQEPITYQSFTNQQECFDAISELLIYEEKGDLWSSSKW